MILNKNLLGFLKEVQRVLAWAEPGTFDQNVFGVTYGYSSSLEQIELSGCVIYHASALINENISIDFPLTPHISYQCTA